MMNISEPSRSLLAEIALTTSLSLTILLAIIGNLMVFLAISRASHLRTQVASVFIVNLAVTDLGCAVLVMPFSLVSVWQNQWVFSSFWCDAVCFLNYCFIIASMLTLALISVDRYVYVVYPLRYELIMTPGRAVTLALVTWIVGLAFAVPPSSVSWVRYDGNELICAIDWEIDQTASVVAYTVCAFIICFCLPTVVMVYCYRGIFKVARMHASRISPDSSPSDSEPNLGSQPSTRRDSYLTKGSCTRHEHSPGQLTREVGKPLRQCSLVSASGFEVSFKKYSMKAIKSIVIMVMVFLICNTLFSLTKLIKVVRADNEAVPPCVSTLASWLAFLNPACNPIIYSIMREDFQLAFCRVLPRCCRRRRAMHDLELNPSLRATGHDRAISKACISA